MGKLEDRLARLERVFPEAAEKTSYMEDVERRGRLSTLYTFWWLEGGEKPDLSHPRDRYWWEYLEKIGVVIDEMAAEGLLSLYAE